MRTCEEYEALISAFIDGALDDDSRGELMVHMAQCPACQAYFDDQIAIHDALEGMEAQEVIARCKGVQCHGGTSCPDQLAKALDEALAQG